MNAAYLSSAEAAAEAAPLAGPALVDANAPKSAWAADGDRVGPDANEPKSASPVERGTAAVCCVS